MSEGVTHAGSASTQRHLGEGLKQAGDRPVRQHFGNDRESVLLNRSRPLVHNRWIPLRTDERRNPGCPRTSCPSYNLFVDVLNYVEKMRREKND